MKKTVRVAYQDFLEGLKRLRYYQDEKGNWRRGVFHLILKQRRRGRLEINLHMDIHSPFYLHGHRTIYKGEKLEKEFERIEAAYKEQRRHKKKGG